MGGGDFGAAGTAWAGFPPARAIALVRALIAHDAQAVAVLLHGLTAQEKAGALAVAWGVADLMEALSALIDSERDRTTGMLDRTLRRHPVVFGDFELGDLGAEDSSA